MRRLRSTDILTLIQLRPSYENAAIVPTHDQDIGFEDQLLLRFL